MHFLTGKNYNWRKKNPPRIEGGGRTGQDRLEHQTDPFTGEVAERGGLVHFNFFYFQIS